MDEDVHCKICSEKLSDIMELKIHIKRHKKRQRTDRDEIPTKSLKKNNGGESLTKSFKEDKQHGSFIDCNHLERKYVECNVCQKICSNESALRRHCLTHVLKNHEKCGICSKIFHNAYSLQDHYKSTHRNHIYTCNICEEQCKSKESLSQHVCSKTYPCNVCNHVYGSKDELLKHFFSHKSLQGSYLYFAND